MTRTSRLSRTVVPRAVFLAMLWTIAAFAGELAQGPAQAPDARGAAPAAPSGGAVHFSALAAVPSDDVPGTEDSWKEDSKRIDAARDAHRKAAQEAWTNDDRAAAVKHFIALVSLPTPSLYDCRQAMAHLQLADDDSALAVACEAAARAMKQAIAAPPESFVRPLPKDKQRPAAGDELEVQSGLDGTWSQVRGPAQRWLASVQFTQKEMRLERLRLVGRLAELYREKLKKPELAMRVLRDGLEDLDFFKTPVEKLIAAYWPARSIQMEYALELDRYKPTARDLAGLQQQCGELDAAIDTRNRLLLAEFMQSGAFGHPMSSVYQEAESLWALVQQRRPEATLPPLVWLNVLSESRPSVTFDLARSRAQGDAAGLYCPNVVGRPGLLFDALEITADMEGKGASFEVSCFALGRGRTVLGSVPWHGDRRKGRELRTATVKIPEGTGIVYFGESCSAGDEGKYEIHRIAVRATFRKGAARPDARPKGETPAAATPPKADAAGPALASDMPFHANGAGPTGLAEGPVEPEFAPVFRWTIALPPDAEKQQKRTSLEQVLLSLDDGRMVLLSQHPELKDPHKRLAFQRQHGLDLFVQFWVDYWWDLRQHGALVGYDNAALEPAPPFAWESYTPRLLRADKALQAAPLGSGIRVVTLGDLDQREFLFRTRSGGLGMMRVELGYTGPVAMKIAVKRVVRAKDDAQPGPAPTAPGADKPGTYRLAHVFRDGQTLWGEILVESQSPMRGARPTSTTTTSEILLNTREGKTPGERLLLATWKNIRVKTVRPGAGGDQVTQFDAAQETKKKTTTNLYASLLGRPFTFLMRPDRRVELVSALDDYFAQVKNWPIPDRKDAWPETLEQFFFQPNAYFPRGPVSVGQTWTVRRTLRTAPMGYFFIHSVMMGARAEEKVTAKLESVEPRGDDRVAFVTLSGRVEHDGQDASGCDLTGKVRLLIGRQLLESQEIVLVNPNQTPEGVDRRGPPPRIEIRVELRPSPNDSGPRRR